MVRKTPSSSSSVSGGGGRLGSIASRGKGGRGGARSASRKHFENHCIRTKASNLPFWEDRCSALSCGIGGGETVGNGGAGGAMALCTSRTSPSS